MQHLLRHLTRCFVAGFVALLPIAGLLFTIIQLESMIAVPWLKSQTFYFPGLGLIVVAAIIYAIGLTVTTLVGRWLWRRMDRGIDALPLFGRLYQTLKQILGYGQGKDAIFKRVVLVPNGRNEGAEVGLVTNEVVDASGAPCLLVFVPGAPNPTSGRLVAIAPADVRTVNMPVNDALKALVSVGVTPVEMNRAAVLKSEI